MPENGNGKKSCRCWRLYTHDNPDNEDNEDNEDCGKKLSPVVPIVVNNTSCRQFSAVCMIQMPQDTTQGHPAALY